MNDVNVMFAMPFGEFSKWVAAENNNRAYCPNCNDHALVVSNIRGLARFHCESGCTKKQIIWSLDPFDDTLQVESCSWQTLPSAIKNKL